MLSGSSIDLLELDDRYTTTHWLRAQAHLAAGQLQEAVDDHDRALALDSSLIEAYSGKALALHRMGRLDEAIDTTRLATEITPEDLINRRNLALLYRQAGQTRSALFHAEEALRLAAAAERGQLEQLIVELRVELGETDGSGQPAPNKATAELLLHPAPAAESPLGRGREKTKDASGLDE